MAVVDSWFFGPYLTSKGWEGQRIAFLVTQLSADSQAVQSMKFNLRGKLTTETVVVKAEKLWEDSGQYSVAAAQYRHARAQLHHNSESQRSPVRCGGVTEDSCAPQHVRGTQHAQEG